MQIINSVKTNPTPALQFELAKRLERSGDYEGAREALSEVWRQVGEPPTIDKLSPALQAEALLRSGALSGWIGSAQQIKGAQEFAKDLISESLSIFERLENTEKVAEAQTDLGICYWRLGAFDEARILLDGSLAIASEPENRLRALVNGSAVEISDGRLDQALGRLDEAAPLVEIVTDPGPTGRYFLQRALVYRRLGGVANLDRALIEYSAASFHLSEAGDQRYVAAVENNIAFVLLELGRHSEALAHLDRARSIFITLKESGKVAEVNEARAQAFIAQQSFAEAERAAFAAVTTLERGDEHSLLAVSLTTYGLALAKLGNYQAARSAFLRAAEVADRAGERHSAGFAYLLMIEELASSLEQGEAGKFFLEADERLGTKVDLSTIEKLRGCARIVAADSIRNRTESIDSLLLGGRLEDEMHHIEAVLIKRALDQAHGSVTGAARLLGVTHQGLDWTLRNRQQQLLSSRTPRRSRRKSIIKKK